MPKIKLVTNVADYGLLHGFAETRLRLVISTLVATGLEIGLGLWSAHYVLEVSSSVVLNLFLITLNMMLMLVAAYLQTLLVGDIFFTGPWREQVILGRKTKNASVRDHNAEFMVILILLVVGNAFAVNYGAGGFLDRYHNEGFFLARMRAEAPEERLAAMEELTDPMNFELWELSGLRELVIEHLDDPDTEVRKHAIWNAGEMKIDAARSNLIDIVRDSEEPSVRAEAAQALGKLGNDREAREALEAIVSEGASNEVLVGALRGLGLMGSPLSADAALPHTESEDDDVMVHAYYVLRRGENRDIRTMLRERLTADPPKLERCALLDTLKMVASKDDVTWARRRYDDAPKKEGCEPVVWEERNERQHYITYSDSFRVKYLKIVANAAGADQLGWFQRIMRDPNESWRVREVAGEVIKQIEDAR